METQPIYFKRYKFECFVNNINLSVAICWLFIASLRLWLILKSDFGELPMLEVTTAKRS